MCVETSRISKCAPFTFSPEKMLAHARASFCDHLVIISSLNIYIFMWLGACARTSCSHKCLGQQQLEAGRQWFDNTRAHTHSNTYASSMYAHTSISMCVNYYPGWRALEECARFHYSTIISVWRRDSRARVPIGHHRINVSIYNAVIVR